MKEGNFEDLFLDDLIRWIYALNKAKILDNYDAGWNASIQETISAVYSFFGRDKELSAKTTSAVNHPDYYCDGGIEVLDYILAKDMDFLLGQVCKYISRAGKKNPDKEIEDLEKAKFYLEKKIEVLKNGH